jgi:hypothetical protein
MFREISEIQKEIKQYQEKVATTPTEDGHK